MSRVTALICGLTSAIRATAVSSSSPAVTSPLATRAARPTASRERYSSKRMVSPQGPPVWGACDAQMRSNSGLSSASAGTAVQDGSRSSLRKPEPFMLFWA